MADSFDRRLLLRWTPGPGVGLVGAAQNEELLWQGRGWRTVWSASEVVGIIDPCLAKPSVRAPIRSMATILRRTASRAPHLNCFGLHEWAMLYQPPGAPQPPERHQRLPLRLEQDALNRVVEGLPLVCTHFDAYRFFATQAAPLNRIRPVPSRAAQPALEQPGCLHAGMDLFRYCLKLWPFLPASLLADALKFAIECRSLDMRASPYDLSTWDGRDGFDLSPVCIETEQGRRQYQQEQSALAQKAAPLRAQLLEHFDYTIAAWDGEPLGDATTRACTE